jgi:hypothetical protein
LFRFVQVEYPWPLGPPDGRYLTRPVGDPEAEPAHVIVIATLGAPERRRFTGRRRAAPPQPDPTPVTTGRATIIDAGHPVHAETDARAWLARSSDDELAAGLAVLNRALHAYRLATADPGRHTVAADQALVARIGFGPGEQVADGLWTAARELPAPTPRRRRPRILAAQAQLAAILGARVAPLACEELALRARSDLDDGRPREAALQLLVALDAALAELATDPHATALADRLDELRDQREPVADAAQAALAGPLDAERHAVVESTLARVQAALRARAAAGA